MEQKPSIGRVVHYTNLGDKDGKYPPEIQMAFVTGVYQETTVQDGENVGAASFGPANKVGDIANSMSVDLLIIYRTGQFGMACVPFSSEPKRGHWNWPPRQ